MQLRQVPRVSIMFPVVQALKARAQVDAVPPGGRIDWLVQQLDSPDMVVWLNKVVSTPDVNS